VAWREVILFFEWEYYGSDNTWYPLTVVGDTTNGLTQSGTIAFQYIGVGIKTTEYIRVRLVSFTSITSGAITSAVIQYLPAHMKLTDTSIESPLLLSEIEDWLVANDLAWAGEPEPNVYRHLFTPDFRGQYVRVDDDATWKIGFGQSNTFYFGNLFAGHYVDDSIAYGGAEIWQINASANGSRTDFGDDTNLIATKFLVSSPKEDGSFKSSTYFGGFSGTLRYCELRSRGLGYFGTVDFFDTRFVGKTLLYTGGTPSFTRCILGDENGVFDRILIYRASLELDSVAMPVPNQSVFVLYQCTSEPLQLDIKNPPADPPSLASGKLVSRGSAGVFYNTGKVWFYDESEDTYTDYTSEANAGTLEMGGDVGDIWYITNGYTSLYELSCENRITVNTANVGYEYQGETYTRAGRGWEEKKVWDITEGFTVSGKYWISGNAYGTTGENLYSEATVVNGQNAMWKRLIITAKGTTAPVLKWECTRQQGGILSDLKVPISYKINTSVKDSSGDPVEDVLVGLLNKNGEVVDYDLTDVNGRYNDLQVTSRLVEFDPYNDVFQGHSEIDLNPFIQVVGAYGYVVQQPSFDLTEVSAKSYILTDNPHTFAGETTANGYLTEVSFDGATKIMTVTGTLTKQQRYDASQAWFYTDDNFQYGQPLLDIDTLNTGWSVVISGTLTGDKDDSTTPTITSTGKYITSDIVLFYDGADLVKASKAYFQVKDTVTALNIEGAVIGFGDATTETRLLYNSSFAIDTLVTDASGEADGYLAFQVGADTFGDLKQITGEYDHTFSTIPRALNGSSIGSSASPEVVRLAPDNEVTLTKTDAGLVSGITVNATTDVIDLADETLSNAYDSLKYKVTADADIDTDMPGCMYYCLFGLPLMKSGTSYTGRSVATIYQNVNIGTDTFGGSIVELATAGSYGGRWNQVQFNFEADGTFDLRNGQFNSSVTVDTINDNTVLAKLPIGVPVTNNDPTNITLQQNEAFPIINNFIIDDTQYFVRNITKDAYIVSGGIVSGGGGLNISRTLGAGEEIETGDEIEIVLSNYTKKLTRIQRTASSGGISFTDQQQSCPICTAYDIDQTTALSYGTIFQADYPNIQIDFHASGTFNWGVDQFFAWCKAMGSTDADFQKNYNRLFHSSSNFGQIVIDSDVIDLFLDNPTAGSIAIQTNSNPNITGRPALIRTDGVSVEYPRTDGGKIILNPSIEVVVATINTTGTPVITGDIADVPTASENAAAVKSELEDGVNVAKINGHKVIGGTDETGRFRSEDMTSDDGF
jgi:hypothetical protein